jgi:hypothetical protein
MKIEEEKEKEINAGHLIESMKNANTEILLLLLVMLVIFVR